MTQQIYSLPHLATLESTLGSAKLQNISNIQYQLGRFLLISHKISAMGMVSPTLELARQRQLLQLEWTHEREEFKRLTQMVGIERRVRRGDC